jgi:hypothetical protein
MYILTDYRLILTKDRPDLSLERADPSGTALTGTSSNSKLQTRPLVREGTTKQQTRNCLKKISRRKKNWSRVSDGRLTPRHRLTVGRNVTLTLKPWLLCLTAD